MAFGRADKFTLGFNIPQTPFEGGLGDVKAKNEGDLLWSHCERSEAIPLYKKCIVINNFNFFEQGIASQARNDFFEMPARPF